MVQILGKHLLEIVGLDEDTFVAVEDTEGGQALLLRPVPFVTVPAHIDDLL